jgi:hypothetical protein
MTQVERLVRQQFVDGSAWTGRDAQEPHDGLVHALRGGEVDRGQVAAVALSLLGSPDLRARTGAVAILRELGPALDASKAAKIVADNAPRFRGTTPAWRIEHADLEQSAAVAIAAAAKPSDTVALAWLRDLAASRKWGFHLLDSLARLDPDWLIAHARGLVPHDHLGVLVPLSPSQQERLIDALSPYPPEKPTFFTKAFWSRLPPADAARLRRRMWPAGT